MKDEIISTLVSTTNIDKKRIESALKLLMEGCTIPFIARYRKDATGGLDEEQIKLINDEYTRNLNLLDRKEAVIKLIDEKGLLNDELKDKIMSATKLVEVEDLYRPFKEKKKTKATDAINNGLEPLAKMIMSFPTKGDINSLCSKFINDKVPTINKAIEGAGYIIAEYISDNAYYRKYIRSYVFKSGILKSKLKKDATDEKKLYEMYYDFTDQVRYMKSYRVLAINRAEKEKILNVSIEVNDEDIINYLEEKIIKNKDSFVVDIVKSSIKDSYKRLIYPSIEREIRSELTEKAEVVAIKNFGDNLEKLLLTPPIKEKVVLAFDPGYTNGCKLAVIDKNGKYLYSTVIKPFASSETMLNNSKAELLLLIKKYNIDIIAIGNGTASRESEKLCSDLIKEYNLNTKYIIVSEAGASIYSTEKVAIDEFPNLTPNERSAVSIGRRLQDPLAELVKIPPEGIGVGLYQHDVSEKNLKESLDFVVTSAVNNVGVNINTASSSLFKYVSGLTKASIDKLIKYREEKGKIKSREELKKSKILSDKVYEQSIGFMRIIDAENILDRTEIHPESYEVTDKILKKYNLTYNDIGTDKISIIKDNDISSLVIELGIDKYTIEGIIASLKKPNRDPREEMNAPILKSDVLDIKDLNIGMKLQGTVRNVIDFGAFVDIGLHNDGLIHISKMSKNFIKHPSEILSVGDIIDVYVCNIDKDKEKVSLSLIKE